VIAASAHIDTPIGKVYIGPNGRAMATWRIGECKGGRLVSTPDLSDGEIQQAGLTGKVLSATADANRIYDSKGATP